MNRLAIVALCLASLLLGLLGLFGSRVLAAEPTPDSLIERGLRLRREGRPADALVLFRQAHALAPSPRTFGQMGLVEASLHQWVDGENHLSVSLANPDDAWVIKNRAFLDEALALCRRHVGDLVVSGAPGAEVFVAGRLVGTLPAVPVLRLAEGAVTVTASAPGFQPFEEKVTIQPGARMALPIQLLPTAAPPPATKPAPPPLAVTSVTPPLPAAKPSGWSSRTWTGISLSTVGAGLLGWGITWIAIDGQPNGDSSYDTMKYGIPLAAVGAAAVAGGIVVVLTGDDSSGANNVALSLTPRSATLLRRF